MVDKSRQSTSIQKGNRIIIFGVPSNITNEEIKDETECADVFRLQKKNLTPNDQTTNTSPVVLTFMDSPPLEVFIGLQRFKTKLFIPNPTRCFKCQRFGHIAQSCRAKARCPRCSEEHDYNNCPLKASASAPDAVRLKCPNCGDDHSAAYKGCKSFLTAKEITTIKVINKFSYAEATKKYLSNPSTLTSVELPRNRATVNLKLVENINFPVLSMPVGLPLVDQVITQDTDSNPSAAPSIQQIIKETSHADIQPIIKFFSILSHIMQSPNIQLFCSALDKFMSDYLSKFMKPSSTINIEQNG